MTAMPTDQRHRAQITAAFLDDMEKRLRAQASSAQQQGDGGAAFDAAQWAQRCAELRRFILQTHVPSNNASRYYGREWASR